MCVELETGWNRFACIPESASIVARWQRGVCELLQEPSLRNLDDFDLPFVEQQALYDKYDHIVPISHPSNRPVVQTVVPIYVCPTDIDTNVLSKPRNGPGKKHGFAPGSYRACSGTTDALNGDRFFDNASVPKKMPRHWVGALHVVYWLSVKMIFFA